MKSGIWVVVADEAIARILQSNEDTGELEPAEEMTDPAAHGDGDDFRRDAYGRRSSGATHGARQNTPHRLRAGSTVTSSAGEADEHLEADAFARQVAQRLAEASREKRFTELRIVAAPRFLGRLRKELSPEVQRLVTQELDKDLIHMDNRDITERLFPSRQSAGAGQPSA